MRRPKVTRFNLKKTYGGRTVKRTVVTRRDINNSRKAKKLMPMRPTRKRGKI